jgi:hypothetical protein
MEKGVSGSKVMIKSALKKAIAEGKIEIMGERERGSVYEESKRGIGAI